MLFVKRSHERRVTDNNDVAYLDVQSTPNGDHANAISYSSKLFCALRIICISSFKASFELLLSSWIVDIAFIGSAEEETEEDGACLSALRHPHRQ